MKRPPKWKRFWLCCRWGVRGCRVALLLVLLALVAGFIWFNQIGMPEFAKTLLQDELKERGLDVEFRRMHWKWFQGIVTEDLVVHPSEGRIGPSIQIQSADVDLDLQQLATGELSVKAIELFHGSGHWLVQPANEDPRTLTINKLHAEIRFLPGDRWELRRFDSVVQGIQISAAGVITNASFARREGIRAKARPQQRRQRRAAMERAELQIHRVLSEFARLRFAVQPRLSVEFSADARMRGEIEARITGDIAALKTPLVECRGVTVNGHVSRAAETNAPVKASLSLAAETLTSPHARARRALGFAFVTLSPEGDWSALWNTGLKQVTSPHGAAAYVSLEGNVAPDPSRPTNQLATLSVKADALDLGAVGIDSVKLTATLEGSHASRRLQRADIKGAANGLKRGPSAIERLAFAVTARTNRAVTTKRMAAWKLDATLDARAITHDQLRLEKAAADVEWDSPHLTVRRTRLDFPDGPVTLDAAADLASRRVTANLRSRINPGQISHLLGPKNERYLAQYQFETPPVIHADAALRLPPGDLGSLEWKSDLEPLLAVAGRIEADAGNFRGLGFDRAHTDVRLTNGVLVLPNLRVRRPEGVANLTYTNHLATRDYSFGIDSRINPLSIGPLLGEGERRGLTYLSLSNRMPHIAGTLFGRWGDLSRTGFNATARMTNLAIRGQPFDRLHAKASMTNQLLTIRDAELARPEGRIVTPLLWIDTAAGRVSLSNVLSDIDFMVIPSIIGPLTARAVRPYEFRSAPEVVINGTVGTHRDAEKDADLHFDLRAPHFHWFKFNLTNVTARLNWVTNRLVVTNLSSGFHGGDLDGWLDFDFDPPVGNDFRFDLNFTNAGLRSLIADIANPTNTLEGALTGRLRVTEANTEYWHSWQGDGHASLTNGLLWQIPVFGIFSPILNTLAPGLGSSKATRADGTFVMTNSLIHTRDLIIHSPPARLYYQGTVDFDANVDARVEAKLFKNRSVVGKLFDALTAPITKIFEYKVDGTLGNPRTKPINELPKILLAPLKPLKAVGDILQGGTPPARRQKK